MALTPETLPRHELNGLHVRVVASSNPDLLDIEGRVVGETMRTLRVESAASGELRVKQVPKQGSTFEFALTDETAANRRDVLGGPSTTRRRLRKEAGTASEPEARTAHAASSNRVSGHADSTVDTVSSEGCCRNPAHDVDYVTVDGSKLLSRPALRTEQSGESKWR